MRRAKRRAEDLLSIPQPGGDTFMDGMEEVRVVRSRDYFLRRPQTGPGGVHFREAVWCQSKGGSIIEQHTRGT